MKKRDKNKKSPFLKHTGIKRRATQLFFLLSFGLFFSPCLQGQLQNNEDLVPDKVFVIGGATQGNGYNWSASLTWISETLAEVVRHADQYQDENPGQMVRIDIAGFGGASSGSAVSGLLSNLIENFKERYGLQEALFSVDQARQLSQAMKFFSLSTDFTKREALGFLGGMLPSLVGNQIRRNPYWSGAAYSQRAFAGFLKRVATARSYQASWHGPIHYPQTESEVPEFINLMHSASQTSKAFHPENLREVGQWQDGFMVGSFITDPDDNGIPLDFKNLKLVFMMNQSTYDILKKDAQFIHALKESEHMGSRILLAVSPSIYKAINVAAREPDLMEPLTGTMSELSLNKVVAFDRDTEEFVEYDKGFKTHLVLGGFPLPEMLSWGAAALTNARAKHWKSKGAQVQTLFSNIGKVENREDPKASFAQRTVVKYFTPDQPEKGLEAFYTWVDEFSTALSPRLSYIDHLWQMRVDWDASSGFFAKRVGAVLQNRAYTLILRVTNDVRSLLKSSAAPVYSPEPGRKPYILETPGFSAELNHQRQDFSLSCPELLTSTP